MWAFAVQQQHPIDSERVSFSACARRTPETHDQHKIMWYFIDTHAIRLALQVIHVQGDLDVNIGPWTRSFQIDISEMRTFLISSHGQNCKGPIWIHSNNDGRFAPVTNIVWLLYIWDRNCTCAKKVLNTMQIYNVKMMKYAQKLSKYTRTLYALRNPNFERK